MKRRNSIFRICDASGRITGVIAIVLVTISIGACKKPVARGESKVATQTSSHDFANTQPAQALSATPERKEAKPAKKKPNATSATTATGVVVDTQSATAPEAFSKNIRSDDLINANRNTLAEAKYPKAHSKFPATGLNDGVANSSTPGGNTYFDAPENLSSTITPTATFELNTKNNPNGYDIKMIRSFAGWFGRSQAQANQKYDVYYHQHGASGDTLLASVDYSPFPTAKGDAYETQVTLSKAGGEKLATSVDRIIFVFQVPSNNDKGAHGSVYRELDVIGSPASSADEEE